VRGVGASPRDRRGAVSLLAVEVSYARAVAVSHSSPVVAETAAVSGQRAVDVVQVLVQVDAKGGNVVGQPAGHEHHHQHDQHARSALPRVHPLHT
jgi:hypothetical protein